jgi:hypothetical protein
MFAANDNPKIDVASVMKIPRANDPPRCCGGGAKYCGGGIIGGGIGAPSPGGGGGMNAPRGSTGPCPAGGGGMVIRLILRRNHTLAISISEFDSR